MNTLTKTCMSLCALVLGGVLIGFRAEGEILAVVGVIAIFIGGHASPKTDIGKSLKWFAMQLAIDARSLCATARGVALEQVRLWILLTATGFGALALLFPPWVITIHSGVVIFDEPLGYGTIFSPPTGPSGVAYNGFAAHVDYVRVGLEVGLLVMLGAVSLVLTYIFAAPRTRATSRGEEYGMDNPNG